MTCSEEYYKMTCSEDDCENRATWMRHTQFAGDHPLCEKCAKRDSTFPIGDGSYTSWSRISVEQAVGMLIDEAVRKRIIPKSAVKGSHFFKRKSDEYTELGCIDVGYYEDVKLTTILAAVGDDVLYNDVVLEFEQDGLLLVKKIIVESDDAWYDRIKKYFDEAYARQKQNRETKKKSEYDQYLRLKKKFEKT